MRLLLLITLIVFACASYGQDSLQIDTTLRSFPAPTVDSIVADSSSSTVTTAPIKKKKQRKKAQKSKPKQDTIAINEKNIENNVANGNNSYSILLLVLMIAVIIVLVLFRLSFNRNGRYLDSNTEQDEFISDDLSRMILPRGEYYRNVYLKSEAWKRKRYLVMKRDNWRCVYCGARATQVHHTRYAKRNIGKEPIEWLVSICKPCHDSKHQ